MSDLQRLVGERLKIARMALKLTQEQLAEKTGREGVSKSRISDIERGRINISLKTLDLLMNTLEMSPTELFNFQRLSNAKDIGEKHIMIDIHKYTLMERDLDEVKYVIKTTKNFFDIIDTKNKK